LWRLDASVSGSGVTGDLLAHCIDTAIWLNGPIQSVTDVTETFIKERHHNLSGKIESVTIDDASAFLARLTTEHSRPSKRRATRAAIRRSIPSKLMAKMHQSSGISMIFTDCTVSITGTKDGYVDGARCTSPMAIIPI
jgi:predicted dehydrogenase